MFIGSTSVAAASSCRNELYCLLRTHQNAVATTTTTAMAAIATPPKNTFSSCFSSVVCRSSLSSSSTSSSVEARSRSGSGSSLFFSSMTPLLNVQRRNTTTNACRFLNVMKRRTASTHAFDSDNKSDKNNDHSNNITRRSFFTLEPKRHEQAAVVLDGLAIADKIAEDVKREAQGLQIKPRLEVLMGKRV